MRDTPGVGLLTVLVDYDYCVETVPLSDHPRIGEVDGKLVVKVLSRRRGVCGVCAETSPKVKLHLGHHLVRFFPARCLIRRPARFVPGEPQASME
jgi:hypothetical protein